MLLHISLPILSTCIFKIVKPVNYFPSDLTYRLDLMDELEIFQESQPKLLNLVVN